MTGLADYVVLPAASYPPEVLAWNSIPQAQIDGFTPPDFCRADCFTGMGDYLQGWDFTAPQRINGQGTGLGALSLTSPDGFFGSSDFTQWGLAEWGTVALAVYTGLSLFGDTKRHVRRARKAVKTYRSAT